MREDIKERIELIREGKVPEGYRKTKLATLPSEWENTKLKELLVEVCKRTIDTVKYPLYSLTLEDGIVEKSERYDREHLVKKEDSVYKVVQPDEFVYNPMNIRFGAVARNKSGKSISVSGYYNIFAVKYFEDKEFMDNYLTSPFMIEYYNKICTGSLEEKKRVHFSDFMQFNLPIPSQGERTQIAKTLDLYNKCLELLSKIIIEKEKEKHWLFNMLLKKNDNMLSTVKLGEIAEKVNEKNCNCKYSQVLSNSARNGVIPQEKQFTKEIANNNNINGYYVIHPNEFVYNPRISVSAPCGPININNTGITGVVSPLYTVFRVMSKNINLNYMKHYFQSNLWHSHMKKVANYGARYDRMNISQHDFFSLPVIIPSITEQRNIVNIMQLKEKELFLLKQKKNLLKQEKKAMMQLLLTGIVRVSEK